MANKYPDSSPYVFVANNPIKYIDPDGNCYTVAENGQYIPCPEGKAGDTRTGAFGYSWTYGNDGWQLTGGADPSSVDFTYIPIEASGDADYYVARYKAHIERFNTRPPDYYLSYGHKYRVRFQEFSLSLSGRGQAWADQTGVELQSLMNEAMLQDPSVQGSNQAFQDMAYETHVPAYTKGGLIKSLTPADHFRILFEPDMKDSFLNPAGRRQIMGMLMYMYPEELLDRRKNPGLKKPGEM